MRVFPQILSFHRGKETNAWIEMLNICDKPLTKRNLRHPLTTTPRPILRSRLGFGGIVTELSDVPFLNYVSIYQIGLVKKTKTQKKCWAIITFSTFLARTWWTGQAAALCPWGLCTHSIVHHQRHRTNHEHGCAEKARRTGGSADLDPW